MLPISFKGLIAAATLGCRKFEISEGDFVPSGDDCKGLSEGLEAGCDAPLTLISSAGVIDVFKGEILPFSLVCNGRGGNGSGDVPVSGRDFVLTLDPLRDPAVGVPDLLRGLADLT